MDFKVLTDTTFCARDDLSDPNPLTEPSVSRTERDGGAATFADGVAIEFADIDVVVFSDSAANEQSTMAFFLPLPALNARKGAFEHDDMPPRHTRQTRSQNREREQRLTWGLYR